MKKVINYLLLLVSSLLFLMFFSCKNIFSEPLTQNTYEQQVEKFGSISGKIDFGNACPQQFITKLCDDNHLTNKKTAFPTIPYDKELTYKIYAQCTEDDTPPIEGTLYSSSDLKLEYYFDSIPFNKNYIIHIEVYLDEQIIISGSSSEFSLSQNTQTEIENIKVTAIKGNGKGNIKLPVQQSNSYDFYYKLEEYSSENRDVLLIDNSYTKTTDNLIKAENISSGVYKLQIIVCAKDNKNDLKYFCTEIVNVFDNLTTDTWISNGEGDEYFSEVPLNPEDIQSEKVLKFTITEDFLSKKSNEIYVDPTSTKNDTTGSYFYPYKTLQDAIDKVLSDSIFDEYTIYLKKDIIITEKPKNGGYVGNIVYAGFDKALTITSKSEPKTIKIAENINHESSTEGIGYFMLGIGSEVKISNINLENSNSKTPIYVNSALNLENVNIKNSYAVANQSPDTLFDNDSAVIYNNNKITLKNVTINNEEAITNKENYNTVYGRAILNTNNYTICQLDNVTIDSCIVKGISGASGGGIYEEGAEEFIVSNSTINNCYANGDGGGIYCRQTCSVQNSTIENCTAAGNGGGIFTSTSTSAYLAVGGKVIIFGNTNTSNNPSNVYLSTNQKISLESSLKDGTLIGITTQEELTETKQQIEFIENDGSASPSYFRSDKDYKIDINDAGMPVLTVYKGNINIEPFYENVKISLDKTNVVNSETINVIVKVDEEEFEITEPNSISVKLNWRNINISSSNTQQITIPEDSDELPPDNYIISVLLTLNGKKYSSNFDIIVKEDQVLNFAKSGSVPAAGDKLTISSGKAIEQIATWVNSGESLEGVEFKLENDVTLPENFVSIGNSSKPFIGTFDGNGKTITVKSFASGSTSLFGYIDTPSGKNCTIENLTLAGDIENVTGNFYGFVNYCQDGVILKNCVNKCNVTATGDVAGFTSGVNNNSYIENCRNEGNLTSTGGMAAGISISGGSSSYKFKKCSNSGTIKGKEYVGGIIAQEAFVTNIMNCYNEGEIIGESYVGGIAGSCYTTSSSASRGITNCYNKGNVTAKQYAGGIVGSTYNGASSYCAISNCVNYGTVTCSASAGGIIGYLHDIYKTEPSRITFAGNFYLEGSASNGIGDQSSDVDGNRELTTSNIDSTLGTLNYWVTSSNPSYESALLSWKKDNNNYLILDMEN